MWTKLSTMDRVGWTHERNNCERWSSLDPDLMVIVAKHYYPEAEYSIDLQKEELLSYLEHCVRWN